MRKLVALAILALLAYGIIQALPDIQRYLKLQSM